MNTILLLYPKTGWDFSGAIAPPYAVLFNAVVLRERGYQVIIVDDRIADVSQTLARFEPGQLLCCGISFMTGYQIKRGLEILALVRSRFPGLPTVAGGIHPTIQPESTSLDPLIDYVITGEGENVVADLADYLSGRVAQPPANNLYISGHGSRELFPIRVDSLDGQRLAWFNFAPYIFHCFYLPNSPRTLAIGPTSRGCPHRCAFCCTPPLYHGKWRALSAQQVIDKIIRLQQRYSLTGVWIRDDNYFTDLRRSMAIAEGLIRRRANLQYYLAGVTVSAVRALGEAGLRTLAESGLRAVKIGAESGSDATLSSTGKKLLVEDTIRCNRLLAKAGIRPVYSFIIGYPEESRADLYRTIELINTLLAENPLACIDGLGLLTPYPGTAYYPLLKQQPAGLAEWGEWDMFSLRTKVYRPEMKYLLSNICVGSIFISNAFLICRRFRSWQRAARGPLFLLQLYYRFVFRHQLFRVDALGYILRLVSRYIRF